MFDLINGVPVHPLVVHAVVVLLPLGVLGAIAVAVRPAWRERYGLLVVGVLLLACLAIPVATRSGRALAARVGFPGEHQRLGDELIWFALPLLVATAALVLLGRRGPGRGDGTGVPSAGGRTPAADDAGRGAGGTSVGLLTRTRPATAGAARGRGLLAVLAVLVVALAVANAVQVYRVGDSGARAAWQGRVASTTAGG